jgi:signal transduction histidine kinase
LSKINKRLVKYFIGIITFVVVICFIGSSLFLSRFYRSYQFNLLENTARDIYVSLEEGSQYQSFDVNAVVVNNGQMYFLGKNRMGIMHFLRNVDYSAMNQKGEITVPNGETFLYYKSETELGYIISFKSSAELSEYLNIVYIILLLVFVTSIILCIPVITYLGNKFTRPILKLQRASKGIAEGAFNVDMEVDTKDEIEELSLSLKLAAHELEKKYSMQRDFIANVSHDFRTPISIIRNYAEAISDNMVDNKSREEYSKVIISEVDRLNSMVGDILKLSKLKEGGYALNKEWFGLSEFLIECRSKFLNIAHDKSIELELSESNIEAYGDVTYLSRVMYNFIENALKFSNKDSKIEISLSSISEGIKVSVKDFGIGIEEEMINDIWNRYYKHSQSGGMGLGLPISSEILKLHGFSYGVESEIGKGSEFYFIIPGKLYRK